MTRGLHAWAWWCWAICAAAAVSLTTNPLTLLLLATAVTAVALVKRGDAPWSRSLRAYFTLAGVVIAVRLVFALLLGGDRPGSVLFRLPTLPSPTWLTGVHVGGAITAESLTATLNEGLRLGAMLICVGAANALANPKRALRSVPAALHRASVAVVVALTVAPQVVESTQRVRRAKRLRGGAERGWGAVRAVVVPVLEDAIDRSLALAAAMEARGFGRSRPRRTRGVDALLLGGVLAAVFGAFAFLGIPGWGPAGLAIATLGAASVIAALRLGGKDSGVTRYRPEPWSAPEWAVAGAAAAAVTLAGIVAWLQPVATHPAAAAWPQLQPAVLAVALLLAAPLVMAPRSTTFAGGRTA